MPREEWYEVARDVDWTLTYVDDEAVFPEWMSGTGKVPREAWSKWEEPYKVTYPEYVASQREKESGAYGVKAALQADAAFGMELHCAAFESASFLSWRQDADVEVTASFEQYLVCAALTLMVFSIGFLIAPSMQHRIVEAGVDKDLFVAGRYIDRYEDRGGGWKIAKRRELIDWARTDTASDSFLKEQSALILGARGHADFSCVRAWP